MTQSSKLAVGGIFSLILLNGCSHTPKPVAAAPPSPPPVQQVTAPKSDGSPVRTASGQQQATQVVPIDRSNDGITSKEKAQLDSSLAKLEDALFDYDKSTIRADALKVLESDVTVIRTTLTKYASEKVTLEGHADQRGSYEYNLALGDARAKSVKEFLVNLGVPSGQLTAVSYGKERPMCSDENEDCWQKNRRVHLTASAK